MTGQTDHEKAIDAAVAAYWAAFTMDDEYSRQEIEAAISAYLKARNAEPVAWYMIDGLGCYYITMSRAQAKAWPSATPLYASHSPSEGGGAEGRRMTVVEKLQRVLQTMTSDDVSAARSPNRERFVERSRLLLECIEELGSPSPVPLSAGGRYINPANGVVFVVAGEDDDVVSFKAEGSETLRYLGRAEFDKRFEPVSPSPSPQTVVPSIEGGRFETWSLADFAGQCRMQAREQLDPEFSQFMAALGQRLAEVASLLDDPVPDAMLAFVDNVDRWGAFEWFNRMAWAIRAQDKAVIEAYRAKGDMPILDTFKNIALSSAMRLVRDYEDEVRLSLATRPAPAEHVLGGDQHPDDIAVDQFAAAMKAKLAKKREEGRGGWDDPKQCSLSHLGKLLVEHIEKGDPVDICNFAMMIHQRAITEADHG
ncbi:hypothetical protein FHT87_005226 [Rhizobium sp. BK316]|uniref:hypothetical protein n=1 Tax=Rhizobium sp. BK316 TaxID=2587053 RepID=UPI0017AE4866|nr:hypothetical protein [Rhizobium sp. BK316]MBB3411273.1 hypothetical protein [Rhizobium sp. BK316]